MAAGMVYGVSDEIHQIFVPERMFDYSDMGADCLGVAVGVWAFRRTVDWAVLGPELAKALRYHAVKDHVRMTSGGGTIPNGGSCDLCETEWEVDGREHHKPTCLIARALLDRIDGEH